MAKKISERENDTKKASDLVKKLEQGMNLPAYKQQKQENPVDPYSHIIAIPEKKEGEQTEDYWTGQDRI